VRALIDEAELTPKPGLVDRRGGGAHPDMDLALMLRSAHALHTGFASIGTVAWNTEADTWLREKLGRIGREMEAAMMRVTRGVNTHRGAIWTLGLLCAAVAMRADDSSVTNVVARAARLACLPDRFRLSTPSNGEKVRALYGVAGACGEAQQGFPHVVGVGLPALRQSRAAGHAENIARLDALIAIIARLEDTCVLSRAGWTVLDEVRELAAMALKAGGAGTMAGRRLLRQLDRRLLDCNASPGGAADLLAATLFLDALTQQS
jgi:triphosphoribosyl-dephospho-CoA synthase